MMLHSLNVLLALLAIPSVFAASADDWQKRKIYQLVTDRFALASDTGTSCDTSARKYCGGSYQGVINHLDYIQEMGFDAVWISPVVANIKGETGYGEAFHGYWPEDFTSLNPAFGSADDLKALSTALHKRSMYLMLDVVVNHVAATSITPTYTDFSPFNQQSDFHPQCFITDYTNQTMVEQCWVGDTTLALVDINTEDQTIVSQLNDWIKKLVSDYNADGIRIDTVKHIRKDFWPDFNSAAGVFAMGEVLDVGVPYVSEYTKVLDTVLDYPTYFNLTAAFVSKYGNMSALATAVKQAQAAYKKGTFYSGAFLENHDNPRFPSLTNDTGLILNAMAFPFIHDGIPILYYGQEQGYAGGNDPANREALWPTAYATQNKPYFTHVKSLIAARDAAVAADSSKYLTTAMTFIDQSSASALIVSKAPQVGLFTNVGASGSETWTIPSSAKVFTANQALVDVLSCKTYTADSNGGLTVTSDSGAPRMLLPTSALSNDDKVCPSVTRAKSSGGSGGKNGALSASVGSWAGVVGGLAVAVVGAAAL